MNRKEWDRYMIDLLTGIAKESECKKLRFGAVLYRGVPAQGNALVYAANNPTPALAHLCEPECIRMKIRSRTESMIGACIHAEEICLWEGYKFDLSRCDIYVQGIDQHGEPLLKTYPEFTCLRCAVQMCLAGLRYVRFWFEDGWVSVTPEQAIEQSLKYALAAMENDHE